MVKKPLSYRYHAEKDITLKGNTQRGITQRANTQKGITQRANTQKGITQRGNTQKCRMQRGNTQKGITRDTSMIVAFLVFIPFNVVLFFTNFDWVCFRFDLTLFPFRLLNFVINIPSYLSDREIVEKSGLLNPNICLMMVMK